MKKLIASALAFILFTTSTYAFSDENIAFDKVENSYTGNGDYNILNANFVDVGAGYWAKEDVTKLAALGGYAGYDTGSGYRRFSAEKMVSKEEALALLLRLIGKQAEVQAAAENLANLGGKVLWSSGYLKVAADLGLITQADFEMANADENNSFGSEQGFKRLDPATREEVAVWLSKAVEIKKTGLLIPNPDFRNIYNVVDFSEMDVFAKPYIETLMRKNIMVGTGRHFRPKRGIKRGEMAKLLVNMEGILYETMGLKQKSGVIGQVNIEDAADGLEKNAKRVLKVRNDDGEADELIREIGLGEDGVIIDEDCVVLAGGNVGGLASLDEGDLIKYVVDDNSKKVLYVFKIKEDEGRTVVGTLQGGLDLDKGLININTTETTTQTFKMRKSLYDKEQDIVVVGYREIKKDAMPYGNTITLMLKNDLVTRIEYAGAKPLYQEVSGTIKDINTKFKYITITNAGGVEETKTYFTDDVVVEKMDYFVSENEVGHIDEMFDISKYDQTDADISDLEVGDIVHLRIEGDKVKSISAKAFVSRKTGDIKSVSKDGDGVKIILNDENLLSLYVPKDALVKIDDKLSSAFDLKAGQYVDVTINDAVISEGRLKNIVKKVEVFTSSNKIRDIYMSRLGFYNDSQNTLSFTNVSRLNKTGFKDYVGTKTYDIFAMAPKIIYNGKRVPLDFLRENLIGSELTAYLVSKDYYGKEKLDTIFIDEGRGLVLAEDVIGRKETGKVKLGNSRQELAFNKNAIVVKDGYLVSTDSLENEDNVQVVMGNREGVIFNVVDKLGEQSLFVCRGRIKDIEKRVGFTVKSFARLKDFNYKYSPIERKFRIDENTKVYEGGYISLDEFLDYGENTKKDKVYTIVADGDYAKLLVADDYATEGVKAKVAKVDDKSLEVVDIRVYSSDDKTLTPIDINNNYGKISTDEETIVIKNGKLVDVSAVRVGDNIEAMTVKNLYKDFALNEEREVEANIIFVK